MLIHQDLFFRKLPTLVRETSRFIKILTAVKNQRFLMKKKQILSVLKTPRISYNKILGCIQDSELAKNLDDQTRHTSQECLQLHS